jgi:Sortilin, neurotensin receptor 3,
MPTHFAIRRLVALILVLAFAEASLAQTLWRPMPVRSEEEYTLGLIGGENTQHMHCTARSESNPDVIYMGHDCAQMWRSGDSGATWQKCLGQGLHATAMQSVEIDPLDEDIVFTITNETYNYFLDDAQGVYRSTDGGANWSLVLQTTTTQTRMYQHCLDFDPSSTSGGKAQRWYAGVAGNRIFRSDNAGDTWVQGASLASHTLLYAVHCHPTDGQTLYVVSRDGLFRSTDRGATIAPLGNLPAGDVSSLAIHPQNPGELYAVVRNNGLYHSTDGGQTFALVRSFDAIFVFLNPGHPEVIYLVGEGAQTIVSSNGGSSWTSVIVTPQPGLGREWKDDMRGAFTGVVPDPRDADKAVAYFNAEFWKTEDGGLHWTDSSTFFTGYNWGWWSDGMSFDVADPDRWVMFCADVSMAKTLNNSDWFTRHRVPYEWYTAGLIPWIGTYSGEIQPVAGSDIILASAGMYWSNKLIRTTDGGANWTIVLDDIKNYLFVGFHTTLTDVCWTHDMRSTDAGATWSEMSYLTTRSAVVIGMCRAQPDTLYAVNSSAGQLFRTDDRGDSWREVTDVSWSFNRMDSKPTIAVHPTNPDIIYTLDSSGDLARFDGTTWTSLEVLEAAGGAGAYRNFVRMVAIDPRHPEILYAEMHTPGKPYIFRSTDAGGSWENISSNLSQVGSGSIQVNPHTGDLLHSCCFGTWVYPPPYESPDALYHKLIFDCQVTDWQSLVDHGAAGTLGIHLADGDSEPRASGLARLRIEFSTALDPATIVPGRVTIVGLTHGDQSGLITSLTLDPAGDVLSVALSAPLPDGDLYTVTVSDQVQSTGGRSLSGDRALTVRTLAGDVDGSGAVGAADILAVRAAAAQVDASTARYDVNCSGAISGGDMIAVHRRTSN